MEYLLPDVALPRQPWAHDFRDPKIVRIMGTRSTQRNDVPLHLDIGMKLKTIPFKKFQNKDWLEFLEKYIEIVQNEVAVKDCDPVQMLVDLCSEYKRMISLDCAVDGQMIVNADNAADQAWSCLNAQLKIELVHPDKSQREAAQRIYSHLLKYQNPTRLIYNKEYEKLGLLLDDLATADEADLKLTHAWDWVVELKKRHAHFLDIYQKRLEHASYIDPGAIKIARQKTEKACKSVNALLEASSLKHDSQTIAQTIERLNASIDAQKALFKQQESQNDECNRLETIEDIDMDDDEMA